MSYAAVATSAAVGESRREAYGVALTPTGRDDRPADIDLVVYGELPITILSARRLLPRQDVIRMAACVDFEQRGSFQKVALAVCN